MTTVDETTTPRLTPEQAAMVEANLPLVAWTISRYYARSDPKEFEDKQADGVLGLMRAAQLFDPEKGYKFSTYAVQWIRSAIQRGHANFEGHGFRYMSGYATGKVRGEYKAPRSIDAPVGGEDDLSLADLLAADADTEADALSAASVAELQAALLRASRDPLDLRVAESMVTGESMRQLAEQQGVTFETIRQRRERITSRLRHPVYGLVARIPKAKEAAMTDTALARTNGAVTLSCDLCNQTFTGPQGLGAHKRHAHGIVGATSERAGKPKKPNRPVLVELVDEDPPPPVVKLPKVTDLDRILNTVEAADMPPGKWMRVAIFVSSRAAKSMATRCRKRTEGGPYEWYAPGDDRLFVRAKPSE